MFENQSLQVHKKCSPDPKFVRKWKFEKTKNMAEKCKKTILEYEAPGKRMVR